MTPGASLARALKLSMPYRCASRAASRVPWSPFSRSATASPLALNRTFWGL
jgi:hypothetical protein